LHFWYYVSWLAFSYKEFSMRCASVFGFTVVLGLATSGLAQAPAQPPPAQTYPYPPSLYQSPDVAKSMRLTAEQVNKLNQISELAQTRFRTNYDKLTEEERTRQIQALNREYTADWSRGARDVFNDDQMARYRQLHLQYGGFNSLTDPEVDKRLKLTDQQRINLREYMEWSDKQFQDINKVGATDRDKGTTLYRDYQKEYQGRFNKLLTQDQQKAWREMTGEPYNFAPAFVAPPRQP
jgi:hypothetical protein